MIGDSVLPIGSVVRINGMEDTDLMIMGVLPQTPDGVVKDYSATIHPVGVVDVNRMILFDAEDVKEVVFEGFRSEHFGNFKLLIKKVEQAHQQKNDQAE